MFCPNDLWLTTPSSLNPEVRGLRPLPEDLEEPAGAGATWWRGKWPGPGLASSASQL